MCLVSMLSLSIRIGFFSSSRETSTVSEVVDDCFPDSLALLLLEIIVNSGSLND